MRIGTSVIDIRVATGGEEATATLPVLPASMPR
jgi:hypothetical protein